MNVYLFEMKSLFKSFLTWTIIIVVTVVLLSVAVFPAFSESGDEVLKILEGFPKEFSAAFGMQFMTMFSYEGFFSFTHTYIALCGAIMAVSMSVSVFAKEKRAKCNDFLLTKPKSRNSIFLSKLVAVLTMLVISNVFYILVSLLLYKQSSGEELGSFFLATLCLLLTQLVFCGIGILISIFMKKIRSISGVATAVGFGAFITFVGSNIIEERALEFFSPFKYFEPGMFFLGGGFDPPLFITGVAVTIVTICASYLYFLKSETHSA